MQFSRLISCNVMRPQCIGQTVIQQFLAICQGMQQCPIHLALPPLPLPLPPTRPLHLQYAICAAMLQSINTFLFADLSLSLQLSHSLPTLFSYSLSLLFPLCLPLLTHCAAVAAKIQLPHALLHNA